VYQKPIFVAQIFVSFLENFVGNFEFRHSFQKVKWLRVVVWLAAF